MPRLCTNSSKIHTTQITANTAISNTPMLRISNICRPSINPIWNSQMAPYNIIIKPRQTNLMKCLPFSHYIQITEQMLTRLFLTLTGVRRFTTFKIVGFSNRQLIKWYKTCPRISRIRNPIINGSSKIYNSRIPQRTHQWTNTKELGSSSTSMSVGTTCNINRIPGNASINSTVLERMPDLVSRMLRIKINQIADHPWLTWDISNRQTINFRHHFLKIWVWMLFNEKALAVVWLKYWVLLNQNLNNETRNNIQIWRITIKIWALVLILRL